MKILRRLVVAERAEILLQGGHIVVCAGQRPDQVGSNPTGARMWSAISKSGGNASLAGEYE